MLRILQRNKQNTAILIFSRTEKEEAMQKQFLATPNKAANHKIAQTLIGHTSATIKETKIPYFLIDSNHQYGESFGEKLSNAISTIFNKGFENVIAVGNDCPNLSIEDILIANRTFQQGKCTIGPANDGGIYMVGINKKSFQPSSFKNLPWRSERLFSELNDYFSFQQKSTEILDFKQDIDSYSDLLKYIRESAENKLLEQFELILQNLTSHHFTSYYSPRFSRLALQNIGLRAPPYAA